ncbi:MAG: hypothetical protein AAF546_00680 [Verrucomicrobiota bacterium]
MQSFISLLLTPLFCCLPSSWLRSKLSAWISTENYTFTPTFSGRTALYLVAQKITKDRTESTALVPDYICNVVHLALEKAGCAVEAYPTDPSGQPDTEAIEQILSRGHITLLLGCPLWGSDGLIDWAAKPGTTELLKKTGTFLVIDLCQAIGLRSKLPSLHTVVTAAIISFNNKCTPGMMGGGILFRKEDSLEIPPAPRLKLRERWKLMLRPIWPLIQRVKRRGTWDQSPAIFDYSWCKDFPYDFRFLSMTKQQLAYLCAIRLFERKIVKKRHAFLKKNEELFVQARYLSFASHALLRPGLKPSGPHKMPYAKPDNAKVSDRPTDRYLPTGGWY